LFWPVRVKVVTFPLPSEYVIAAVKGA